MSRFGNEVRSGVLDFDEDDEDDFRLNGDFMNDMDLFTWDVIVKSTPRLPSIETLIQKNQLKHRKFLL